MSCACSFEPGTRRGRVVILGGGFVGRNAATIAVGMGAQVTCLDVRGDTMAYLHRHGCKGYVTLSGKGGERRPIALGRWRWPIFGYAAAVLSLSVVLPYAAYLRVYEPLTAFPEPDLEQMLCGTFSRLLARSTDET